ncbi:NAD(P)H-binding protein [Longispora albida]|uniref:NAD(P)H-binding protein n=1 Tax=Longispora albida TaxID=203523 RepID=UPI000371E55D|nr:NAD(P)H-binding protein [Longispora albida]
MGTYRAVVVGGTGAVGSSLVSELLASPACTEVVSLGRRAGPEREGLTQHVVDLRDLESATAEAGAGCTVAFCTLGMGQPSKESRADFLRVDVEYPAAFARGAKAAGAGHISLLSSVGASESSRAFYLRVKGMAEAAMSAPGFGRVSLFRPSLLTTPQSRYGWRDTVYQAVIPKVSWALPSQYHEISVADLGRAMRLNAERTGAGLEVLYYKDFAALLRPVSGF